MKKTILFLGLAFILGVSPLQLFAQSGSADYDLEGKDMMRQGEAPFTLSGNVMIAIGLPNGRFKGKTDALFGGGFLMMAGPRGFPIKGGISFESMVLDRRLRQITVSSLGFFDEVYDAKAASFVNIGSLVLRVEPDLNIFPVQLYVDGVFGFNHFITVHALTLQDNKDDFIEFPYYNDYRTREKSDWTHAFGGAAGVQLVLPTHAGKDNTPHFALDFRFVYKRGGVAEYMIEDRQAPIPEFPIEVFVDEKSASDLIMIQIGAGFRF